MKKNLEIVGCIKNFMNTKSNNILTHDESINNVLNKIKLLI